MALTSQQIQDIYNRTAQIYTEMGNTPQANAQIAREANAAGLSAADLSTALNVPEAQVVQLAAEAGEPLSSVNPFGTGSNITIGGDTSGITTEVTGTGGITDLGTSGNGITLGGGGTNIDLTTGGSGVTIGGDTSGITTGVDAPPPPAGVDLSGLTAEQQAFAQTLSPDLQDDYIASIGAGFLDETSGLTVQDLAGLLRDRGLSFEEAAQATGLTADDPNYQAAVRAYYGLEPTASDLTPGGMQTFNYTDFPGGVFGPGQALPNIFVPTGQQQPTGTAPPAATPGATPPAAPGPTTMVSPGITTYAYPQPFGEIDIFGRQNQTAPTAYTPPPANNTNTNNT